MITLAVILSERCNLNCTYCGVDKLSKKVISPEPFLKEYKKIRSKKLKEKIQIDFFGGEPLLQWSAIKTIVAETKKDNCTFVMPTNGLLLDEKKVDYLNQNNIKVTLSFDGLWQDLNRKQHGGTGTLDRYLKKRSLFKRLNNSSTCHTMIYGKDNLNLVENHLYMLNNFGFNAEMTLVRDKGVWTKKSAQAFNEAFKGLVDWYIENVNHFEMPKLIVEYLRHMLLYAKKKQTIQFCGAGETLFSFAEEKIVPCNRFKKQEEIDKIPEFTQMKECQSCEVNNYCKKGCIFENIKNGSPIGELCDMYRFMYKEIASMVKVLRPNKVFSKFLQKEIDEA